jgi:hypothetical protein
MARITTRFYTNTLSPDARYMTQRGARAQRGSDGMGNFVTSNRVRNLAPELETLHPRIQDTIRGGDGLGRFGRMGMYMQGTVSPADDGPVRASTNAVTVAAANGGTVVTTTSANGSTTTTAPAVTPPSVLKQKIGNATGALGFLKWAQNALPADIAQAVIAAALARSISYRSQGGQLGVFGDTTDASSMIVDPSTFASPDMSTISTTFDPQSVDLTQVASNQPPSTSWSNAMSQTVASVAAGLLSTADAASVNSITNANLQRAVQGRAPMPVAAGAGIGLTAAASGKTLLWGGAILGVILLLMSTQRGR